MSFEYEDKMAWLNSEVMREFEKIAMETDILNPLDAFLVPEEKEESESFEEDGDEEKLGDAVEEFLEDKKEPDLQAEYSNLCKDNLVTNLQDLAHDMAERGRMKVAYRIERAIYAIKVEGK